MAVEMTNNDRVVRLGEAIYGPWWKMELARLIGRKRFVVQRWASGAREPDDQTVCMVLAAAKKKRDEIDRAIKSVTLYPWIT